MPIYMNWGDTTPPAIRGDVDEAGHIGWIELESVQYGTTRNKVTSTTGNPSPPKPSVSEIVVTKVQDIASPGLFRESLQGTGKKVRIDFVKDVAGKPQVYLSLVLENVMVSSFKISGQKDKPLESLSLDSDSVQYGPAKAVQPHVDRWDEVGK